MEHVTFQTSDRITIVGDWSQPKAAKRCVLCLHMMPATRISWLPLSRALNEAGFATLAIDLRGHGGSTTFLDDKILLRAHGASAKPSEESGSAGSERRLSLKLNYENFTDAEHQASRLDVDAAVNFLKSKGFNEGAIAFVGASIGANLSLDALSRYSSTKKAILLSPGLDYRGVKTEPAMKNLSASQKVWIVAAEEDQYSADSSIKLQQLRKETATVTVFAGSDHGTNLFNSQPILIPEIVKFLAT